jgi:hypothetical protein
LFACRQHTPSALAATPNIVTRDVIINLNFKIFPVKISSIYSCTDQLTPYALSVEERISVQEMVGEKVNQQVTPLSVNN